MKIKTKKVMTEKEYLHYVIDKTDFLSISHDFTHVDHDIVHSDIVLELHDHNNVTRAKTWVDIEGETVFETEIEEEITEDTVIPKMLVKFKNPDTYGRFKNDSINGFEIEEGNIEAFYIINNDLTMTLIWRDGEIIE